MERRQRVVVGDYLERAEIEEPIIGDVARIDCLNQTNEQALVDDAKDADAVILFHDMKVSERSLSTLTRCKGIVRVGVGFDNVDGVAAGKLGIVVCNVPDYGTEDVADHALLMLLAIARRFVSSVERVRGGEWTPSFVFGAPRLRGQTLGIIGCGRIGTAMALRAKALGMRVVFYDPYAAPGLEKALGVERSFSLKGMLAEAQFVSVHCPLTDETRHILNAKTLAYLPDGAYVVNTARGPCIDPEGLLEALQSGKVAFAGLDVLEREPLDDDRLRRHPKIVITPHAAYYSAAGFVEMRSKAAEEIRRMLTGQAVRNPVNLHALVNPRCPVPPRQSGAFDRLRLVDED